MENPEIELLLLLAVSLSPNSIKDIASASGIKPEFPDHITMPQSVAPQRVMA